MSTALITVAVLAFLAYAAYSVKIMVAFKSFCESIARAEGRMDDYAKIWGTDEDGMNGFEREQYWRVMRRDFDAISDPALLATGQYLANRFRILFAVATILLLVGAGIVFGVS